MNILTRFLIAAVALATGGTVLADTDCQDGASDACFFAFQPVAASAGSVHYYASLAPGSAAAPTDALIAMHGHSRDANKTFDAALRAVRAGDALGRTLVVAPLFQVDAARAAKCRTAGVPAAQPGDLSWTCASWLAGARAVGAGAGTGSFEVLDALVAELKRQWPSLNTVTIAGFSAGAQMVQHAIGFAQPAPAGVRLRYVVADPGTWLYFDALRPQTRRDGVAVDPSSCGGADFPGRCSLEFVPPPADCSRANAWKYGTDALPATLGRNAAEGAADARVRYAAAEIHYLEGALDSDDAKGTAFKVLDRSCAANAQGPFRLQRGVAYAAYDRRVLAPVPERTLAIVPGCAHDVACVFPSAAGRAALLGRSR